VRLSSPSRERPREGTLRHRVVLAVTILTSPRRGSAEPDGAGRRCGRVGPSPRPTGLDAGVDGLVGVPEGDLCPPGALLGRDSS